MDVTEEDVWAVPELLCSDEELKDVDASVVKSFGISVNSNRWKQDHKTYDCIYVLLKEVLDMLATWKNKTSSVLSKGSVKSTNDPRFDRGSALSGKSLSLYAKVFDEEDSFESLEKDVKRQVSRLQRHIATAVSKLLPVRLPLEVVEAIWNLVEASNRKEKFKVHLAFCEEDVKIVEEDRIFAYCASLSCLKSHLQIDDRAFDELEMEASWHRFCFQNLLLDISRAEKQLYDLCSTAVNANEECKDEILINWAIAADFSLSVRKVLPPPSLGDRTDFLNIVNVPWTSIDSSVVPVFYKTRDSFIVVLWNLDKRERVASCVVWNDGLLRIRTTESCSGTVLKSSQIFVTRKFFFIVNWVELRKTAVREHNEHNFTIIGWEIEQLSKDQVLCMGDATSTCYISVAYGNAVETKGITSTTRSDISFETCVQARRDIFIVHHIENSSYDCKEYDPVTGKHLKSITMPLSHEEITFEDRKFNKILLTRDTHCYLYGILSNNEVLTKELEYDEDAFEKFPFGKTSWARFDKSPSSDLVMVLRQNTALGGFSQVKCRRLRCSIYNIEEVLDRSNLIAETDIFACDFNSSNIILDDGIVYFVTDLSFTVFVSLWDPLRKPDQPPVVVCGIKKCTISFSSRFFHQKYSNQSPTAVPESLLIPGAASDSFYGCYDFSPFATLRRWCMGQVCPDLVRLQVTHKSTLAIANTEGVALIKMGPLPSLASEAKALARLRGVEEKWKEHWKREALRERVEDIQELLHLNEDSDQGHYYYDDLDETFDYESYSD